MPYLQKSTPHIHLSRKSEAKITSLFCQKYEIMFYQTTITVIFTLLQRASAQWHVNTAMFIIL